MEHLDVSLMNLMGIGLWQFDGAIRCQQLARFFAEVVNIGTLENGTNLTRKVFGRCELQSKCVANGLVFEKTWPPAKLGLL